MLATVTAELMGYGLPLVAFIILAAAVAAFLYVPLIGKQAAVGLIALAAATFAYDLGFNERAALDKSIALSAQVVQLKAANAELQREAEATSLVASDAKMAAQNAEDHAAINEQKVAAYEVELAKRPAPACGLSADDVSRLRNIGAGAPASNPPEPPRRPAELRPVGEGAGSN